MFDQEPGKVVDIFAETEKPGNGGVRAAAPIAPDVVPSHGPSLLLLGGAGLVLLALGGGAVWLFAMRAPAAPSAAEQAASDAAAANQAVAELVANEPPVIPIPVVTSAPANIPATVPTLAPVEIPPTQPTEVIPEPVTTQIPPPPPPVAPIIPVDTDGDGLMDDEEAKLGTSPKASDSDMDGLSDKTEVRTYGTDPLDPDSDDDTYPDGTEIKNGYNPLGPGKLLGMPKP